MSQNKNGVLKKEEDTDRGTYFNCFFCVNRLITRQKSLR